MPPFSICIGRQLASGGRAVGQRLARRLGATYYDREVLDLAARESGMSREVFERSDERRGFFSTAVRSMGSFVGMNGLYTHDSRDLRIFELQADAIRAAAGREDCIFIGRAADYILRELPRLLTVFICADEEERISNLLAGSQGEPAPCSTPEEARRMMERVDAKRAAFYNFYSNKVWGAAASYDLCINVTRTGLDGAVDIIAKAL
ncbi:MAG: cytidylate kinase-like family protein [Alloprevotella sp.]|nr:cytidylate kinase-like family protein [Alloprevotella sp.]